MSTCKKPDRDVPKLVCGYPLPCPHHTIVIDDDKVEIPIHADPTKTGPAIAVAKALKKL